MNLSIEAQKLCQALANAQRVFLDTAVLIYHVEQHPVYAPMLEGLFERIGDGRLTAVCSAVTLAECLVAPLKQNNHDAYQMFLEVALHARNTIFVPVDADTSQRAAELRVRYNLTLTDAFQVAAAVLSGCDAFLTNDTDLKRVREISVVVLEDFR